MSLYKTPLRYPGGKQRLWNFVDEVLEANCLVGGHYVEPFAGGAGVAMELLLRNRVKTVHLNDSCVAVYSFWRSILDETERFCRKISRASMTVAEWRRQREVFKSRGNADPFDLGFAMFYLNRCNRSGILTGGLIGGLSQAGEWRMDVRFPRNELITRIEAIAARKRSIKVKNWDAERFLESYVTRLAENSLIYCDPPYFRKAERLYPNHYSSADHDRLARLIQAEVSHHWLVSYDNCPQIAEHYRGRRSFEYLLQYNASTAYKGSELFIFSDNTQIPKVSKISTINFALSRLAA